MDRFFWGAPLIAFGLANLVDLRPLLNQPCHGATATYVLLVAYALMAVLPILYGAMVAMFGWKNYLLRGTPIIGKCGPMGYAAMLLSFWGFGGFGLIAYRHLGLLQDITPDDIIWIMIRLTSCLAGAMMVILEYFMQKDANNATKKEARS